MASHVLASGAPAAARPGRPGLRLVPSAEIKTTLSATRRSSVCTASYSMALRRTRAFHACRFTARSGDRDAPGAARKQIPIQEMGGCRRVRGGFSPDRPGGFGRDQMDRGDDPADREQRRAERGVCAYEHRRMGGPAAVRGGRADTAAGDLPLERNRLVAGNHAEPGRERKPHGGQREHRVGRLGGRRGRHGHAPGELERHRMESRVPA
jgi:hypothetical protein